MALVPYDDRDGVIWFDGELVDWREAKVHVLSHALHYASSVFEGMRAYGGEIFKLTEHSERLIASAAMLDITVPYSAAQLDEASRAVIAANGWTDCYVRPLAWRGSGQMGVTATQAGVHVMIAAWPWGTYFSRDELMQGIKLTWATYKRPDPATIPATAKAAGCYMICTIEKQRAEAAGFSDALMLDWRGYVAECTGANIFFVRDGAVHTPTPDCFLDGITRRTAIDLLQRRGIEVIERRILPEELSNFSECFITGTAAEITPVGMIAETAFKPGDITSNLLADYAAAVHPQAAVAAQ